VIFLDKAHPASYTPGVEEEFPSFTKKPKAEGNGKSVNSWLSLSVILIGFAAITLAIFLSFRFLVGAKTSREEILSRILSSSQSRQSSLLLEWMQNIDQSSEKNWNPTTAEQTELMHFVHSRLSELSQNNKSPALYALHVASWGPGLADRKELEELFNTTLSDESRMAVLLFLLRQKDFSESALNFEKIQSSSSSASGESEAFRKVMAAYLAQCVESGGAAQSVCMPSLEALLADESDEVRWNASLGLIRAHTKKLVSLSEKELALASSELDKLYTLIKTGDPTLLSRFQGAALESLASEVFSAKLSLSPVQTRQDLEQISNSNPDLRVRNIARFLLAKESNRNVQEK
jgi:hypothetical protein